jgi:hypothetical protein
MVVSKGLMLSKCFEFPSCFCWYGQVVSTMTSGYLAIMGKRSGVVEDEASLSAFSLEELDREIARCKVRLDLASSRELEKAFEKRIHKLERIRTRIGAVDG